MTYLYYLIRDLPLNPIRFFGRSLTSPDLRAAFFALAVFAGAALTYIAVATLLERNAPPAPRPHICVHPTAMPATWYGDCGPGSHEVRR